MLCTKVDGNSSKHGAQTTRWTRWPVQWSQSWNSSNRFQSGRITLNTEGLRGSSDPRRQRLCPVRALRRYVTATAELRRSDQLFVCFSPGKLGSPLSKQRLSQWFIEVVKAAYDQAGQTLPPLITGHSLRSVATSWAALKGTPLSEICAAATWSSPCVFSRFYRVNVAAPHSLAATVLA